jgi:phage recombination protein Bet
MNDLVKTNNIDNEIFNALKNSIYPGAADESITMVLEYCRVKGYDPLGKAVHIVPMSVSTGQKDSKGWDIKKKTDVIMPGIASYRIDAVRTGAYAGITDPEFGPIIKKTFSDGSTLDIPEWCRITVKKIIGSQIIEFSAKEFWIENYATAGAREDAPNYMWKKRPFAQLAKCAEAQALRKAFPDVLGAQVTFEEMEGKEYGEDEKQIKKTKSSNRIEAMKEKHNINGAATISEQVNEVTLSALKNHNIDDMFVQNSYLDIEKCINLPQLKECYSKIFTECMQKCPDRIDELRQAKDKAKEKIQVSLTQDENNDQVIDIDKILNS